MKKLLTSIVIAAFATGIVAQDGTQTANAGELDALKAEIQAQVKTQLDGLGEEVKAQIQEAKAEVEAAKTMLQSQGMAGKSDEEKDAALKDMAQVQTKLQDAVQSMDQVSAQVKEKIAECQDEIQKQLQDKQSAADAVKAQVKDGSGTGPQGPSN